MSEISLDAHMRQYDEISRLRAERNDLARSNLAQAKTIEQMGQETESLHVELVRVTALLESAAKTAHYRGIGNHCYGQFEECRNCAQWRVDETHP